MSFLGPLHVYLEDHLSVFCDPQTGLFLQPDSRSQERTAVHRWARNFTVCESKNDLIVRKTTSLRAFDPNNYWTTKNRVLWKFDNNLSGYM